MKVVSGKRPIVFKIALGIRSVNDLCPGSLVNRRGIDDRFWSRKSVYTLWNTARAEAQ